MGKVKVLCALSGIRKTWTLNNNPRFLSDYRIRVAILRSGKNGTICLMILNQEHYTKQCNIKLINLIFLPDQIRNSYYTADSLFRLKYKIKGFLEWSFTLLCWSCALV